MIPSDQAGALWPAGRGYLDTAFRGLPPRPTVEAARALIDDWAAGRWAWSAWLEALAPVRAAFGRLVGAPAGRVGIGHTTAGLTSLVAANLPAGARVRVSTDEHNSNVLPYRHAPHGLTLDPVPFERLAEGLAGCAALVVSAIRSSDGRCAPLHELRDACDAVGALLVVDATQAAGAAPVEAHLCDVLIASGYKWLMGPNGPAFIVLSEELAARWRPVAANWFAGADPGAAPYGLDTPLAGETRRFDVTPSLLASALGPSLALLEEVGVTAAQRHGVGLAARVRHAFGIPETGSAIVALPRPEAAGRLAAAGLRVTARAGGVRLSFHLHNDAEDVDRVLEALGR